MRRATFLAVVALCIAPALLAQQSPRTTPLDLASTWLLTAIEPGGTSGGGTAQPNRVANPRGLLIFDTAGHAYEFITSLAAQRTTGGQTPIADAQATFAAYGGFWGNYRVDEAQKKLTYRPEAGISPQMTSAREFSRSFQLEGNRLNVTSIEEPQVAAGTRWIWDRVPPVDNLSPLYKTVVGFWRHVVEKRVNVSTGAVLSETKRSPSVIVYTPAGFVGVHFPPLNRKPFAADMPTAEEARAALMGYIGYYGALTVYPGEVFHNILAGVSPAAGTTLRRFADIVGDELTVRLTPTGGRQGQETNTIVILKRLSGEAEMLPRR